MRALQPALSLLALSRIVYGDALPYNPTRIFLPTNSTTAYVFRPLQSSSQAQLLTLDIDITITTQSHHFLTESDTLPFLQDDALLPYTPTIDSYGNITVFAGNCSEGATGAQVWQFTPESSGASGDKHWTLSKSTYQQLGDDGSDAGSNFLASGVAFSDKANDASTAATVYLFAGMCPSNGATSDDWQSSAEYSNMMVTIAPQSSSKDSYDINALADRGPPIAQAGSSITALTPTYSVNSDGELQTQQQDFVLLGGHTQTAFINTSQVAIFSLPQETWSFVPVQQPSDAKSDLTIRQSQSTVTPRSGHTAVLSEDGTKLVVFGGWVGDVNTPADPQLAVLELGAGYGGSGDWQWMIPAQSGNGLPSESGIYGHGAAMLPGGVMMVLGGYEIPSTASKLIRWMKRDTQAANDRMLLYNTTSSSWVDSYSMPQSLLHQFQDKSGPLSSKSQKVGLGAGLGIGAALLVTVCAFYFWYSKRVKRARQDRERAILAYSSDGSSIGQMDQPFLNTGGIDGRGGHQYALNGDWQGSEKDDSAYPRPPPMQHTTGTWVNVPSPNRGLRRGASGKGYQYQAAPRFDDGRMSRASGQIHSIAEHENEDEHEPASKSRRDRLSEAEEKLRDLKRVLGTEDPFVDPEPAQNSPGSRPVSPLPADTLRRVPTGASKVSSLHSLPRPGEQDSRNWMVTGSGSDDGSYDGQRGSPSRSDDRTSSTLSEQSQRSTISTNSITRTMSTRTGAMLAAAAAAGRFAIGQEPSPTNERNDTMASMGSQKSTSYFKTRARSSTNESAAPNTPGGDSFVTARSNFVQLQNEGEALLGGASAVDRDDPYKRAMVAQTAPGANNSRAGSYSTRAPPPIPPRKRPNLFGSLRRALNAVSATGERAFSLTGTSGELLKDNDMRSSSSSPTKARASNIGSSPRRAVSDGGALLRQKRGQQDWNEKNFAPYHDDPDAGDWGEPKSSLDRRQAEEDWDVESAATNRDFQVMFSVPKARLRVVNDDMDRVSLRSASDGAVSRNGSVKALTREESINALRGRSESDKPRLATTEEEDKENEDLMKIKAA